MTRLNVDTINKIHERALDILEKIGMKIMYTGFHSTLREYGAVIDSNTNIVKFPPELIENTIEGIRKDIQAGGKQFFLNGVTCPETDADIKFKVAGACIQFLDPLTREIREPSYEDLIRLINWGENVPEVKFVGNPVCALKDEKGNSVPGHLQRIKTAAAVAKYSTKCGSNEVWNETELDLLIELGEIVRGGSNEYLDNPCFVTAKETIAPLYLPEDDGRILHMLAERKLPCLIVPMPISGSSSPVSIAGNIAMTCAEVLGVMACIRAVCPESMVSGGVISGVMDMREGYASFAAPETIMQDNGAAQIFKEKYGQNFAIGAGYIDAAFPGAQSCAEVFARIQAAQSIGHCFYPIGLLFGGIRWSPEQAYIGMEMAKYAHRLGMQSLVDDDDMPFEIYQNVGIGGSFIGEEHTFEKFRESIWMSELMERSLVEKPDMDVMIMNARDRWSDFLNKPVAPAVDDSKLRDIELWEERAIKLLSK